jgi:hypothetical protein
MSRSLKQDQESLIRRCSQQLAQREGRKKKYWEIIADNLGASGWSWGCSSHIDSAGRLLFAAEAHGADRESHLLHNRNLPEIARTL